MSQLRARPPSGKVAYPTVLVEGEEKAGKTYAALRLSASPRVGRTFAFDLGEGTVDEYAELGPFEVVEHNGTYADLLDQMRLATLEPSEEGHPNVIVLDDGTALWDLIKDWVVARARASKAGQRKLKEDPDAEIDPSMNLWNDGKERWYAIIDLLRRWPGIGVITAQGKEVSKVVGGQPVAGQSEWKVDAEKTTPFAVSAWVRLMRPHVATLIGVRSLHVDVPRGGLRLPDDNPLEHLVFDILGAGGGSFVESSRIAPSLGLERAQAKQRLIELVKKLGGGPRSKDLATDLWRTTGDPPELTTDQWDILEEVTRVRVPELLAAPAEAST